MICDNAHEFEGWFSESADFDRQKASGFLTCPVCSSANVTKPLMAPSVATGRRKEERQIMVHDQAQREAYLKLKEAVAAIRANSEDVGERFAEEARKIHYGEADQRGIIGSTSIEEARELIEEGIEVAPLPVFPDEVN
nr:DUF1178 family protein [Allorhizobium sonneratiae]